MKKELNTCPDCGNAPVNHALEKFSNGFSAFLKPLLKPIDFIWFKIETPLNKFLNTKFLPKFYRLLVRLHLAKMAYEPDERTTGRARVFWDECRARGIDLFEFRLFGKGREFFISYFRGREFAFDNLPRPGKESKALHWMDDKGEMRKRFQQAGIPVALGGTYFSFKNLLKDFEKLSKPVIIKPHSGSRSRHTTTHIETREELKTAFEKAKQLSPFVIMEEEHEGFVYRGTLIGGKVVGVLCREPAHVVGDGEKNIRELIEEENKNPRRDENIFHKIVLNEDSILELSRQGFDLKSIPEKGKIVTLSQKSSRGLGGGITNVGKIIHEDNLEILNKIAEVLKDPLVGVDFIIPEIDKSWKEQKRCGVIECNSMPFIDLHMFPLKGEPVNTASILCDLAFPESKTFK